MKILVTNDDGINAIGLKYLVEMAKKLGEVTVIAPASQCSAMSQRITIGAVMRVNRVAYPIDVAEAYSVEGTPADCIKIGLQTLLKDNRPDIVFSGINAGYNTGCDITYSGTVAACMESLVYGVPALAFSTAFRGESPLFDEYLLKITQEVLEKPIGKNQIWNINIPDCEPSEYKGILWDRTIGQKGFYDNGYDLLRETETSMDFKIYPVPTKYDVDGTDVAAVTGNYTSVSRLTSMIVNGE